MFWQILKTAVDQWFRRRSPRRGAALAYYSVFSLGPLLLIVTSVAGLFFGAETVRGSLTAQFGSLLGETGGKAVEAMMAGASSLQSGRQAAILGSLLLRVAALGVVVQHALNTIWNGLLSCDRRDACAMYVAYCVACSIPFFETEIRAWYGLEPLWKVFWGYGVLASSVMVGSYAIALVEERIAVQQLLIVVFSCYTAWILVSVWRCAGSSAPLWRTLARSLTVAWALNSILVLLFLQLGLIAGYIT